MCIIDTYWLFFYFYLFITVSDVNVCVNYEANGNNTVMGIFICPLEFEPTTYKFCCGEEYLEYCCDVENR